ncbi:MAG: hypothetical protein ABIF87_07145 [Pseudomonadota bacterium]
MNLSMVHGSCFAPGEVAEFVHYAPSPSRLRVEMYSSLVYKRLKANLKHVKKKQLKINDVTENTEYGTLSGSS